MNYYRSIKFTLVLLLSLFSHTAVSSETTKLDSISIDDNTFSCIRDLNKVRSMYVGNLLGNLEATLSVANSKDGGIYPTGSVIQLVPTEVMVKQPKGTSPATKDWEFFELEVSKQGSKIKTRGFLNVINKFGGNCFGCHIKAQPKWDLICETGHGCDPLPLTKHMFSFIQKTDPRCESNGKLNEDEIKAAGQLKQMMAASTKKKPNND